MAVTNTANTQSAIGAIRVWDLGVRLFHWLFAAGMFAELTLGFLFPSAQALHVYIGYGLAGLIAFRIVWGFTGTAFARFSSFPPSVSDALAHIAGRLSAGLGHNPLGAWMVYGLLGIGLAMIVTGLAALGGVERLGPASPLLSVWGGELARALHEAGALLLAAMIAAHIAGVIYESRREKQSLIVSMITGDKAAIGASVPAKPPRYGTAAAAFAVLGCLAVAAIMGLTSLPQPRVPRDSPLAAWTEECGACHTPHHPSLLPAKTWEAIMAGLSDHFGEDASLPGPVSAQISAWLAANSAENFDTKAANWFRQANPAEPLRITATARWKEIHDELPQSVFTRAKVGSPANCGACHGDADAGRFNPAAIHIPPA